MAQSKKIWNYTLEEITQGYAEDANAFICPICGRTFEKGRIFHAENQLYDSYGAVRQHREAVHGSTADYLLEQPAVLVGITDIQQTILRLMSEGKEDKEIAVLLGIAPSTVRSHRFKLREREKQARLFLALMQSLEEKTRTGIGSSDKGEIEELHTGAAMVDDRYAITEQEREKAIKTYMDQNGALLQFPAREKKKIIILREVMKNFKPDCEYSEKEVNRILKRIYEEDYPSLRRALIEYGFMERTEDCSVYRVRA